MGMSALLLAVQGTAANQTVWDFLRSGGPVMIPIAVCSIVALAFAIERWGRLSKAAILPARLSEPIDLVEAGRTAEALRATQEIAAPASRILASGLRRAGYGLHDVEGAMEDQGRKELDRLRANIRPLHLIAGVSPLLGLLGTVIGIQDAFHSVVRTGLGKPEHLAAGIEEALVTTIAGLCVAIPTMLVAAHLTNKARRLLVACDDRLSPLVEKIARRPEERHAA